MRIYLTAILALISSISFAYTVNPANLDLKPSDGKVTGVFIVTNDDKKDLAVNVDLKTKTIGDDGKEKRGEVDSKELIVFPTAVKIKPNSTAAFRVFYNGKDKIDFEKNFRIIFTEVKPRKLDKKKSGNSAIVVLNTAYANNVNILPSKGEKEPPEIKVISEKNGQRTMIINNNSNFRIYLKSYNFIAKDKKGKIHQINPNEVDGLDSIIQAKSKRKINLPLFKDLDAKSTGVYLDDSK